MFKDCGNGYIDIQGLTCYYPKQPPLEEIDGYYLPKEQQKFTRTPLPKDWFEWRKEEAKYQKNDPDYAHPQIEAFKLQEWTRRLRGYWYINNGTPTYLTGLHYMYCNWWRIDIGYPQFRDSDLKYFYFLQYCIDDPDCLGMIDIARRRSGKTYKAGLFLYEYTSRASNAHAGIQSKTDKDAKQVFAKGIVSPFKHLPDFFRPNFDTSGGNTPKTELRFFSASRRGKDALNNPDDELESYIDFAASGEFAYDGSKLQRYVGDETGKTVNVDVDARHQVTKFCAMEGSDIIGKMLYTTTVEEMEKGGKAFKDMWEKSDQAKKNENGRTVTGLYRFITYAQDSMYYDDYGIANEERANTWIDAEIRGMGKNTNEIASFKRKYPRNIKEAFYTDAKDCVFNAGIINERLAYLDTYSDTVPGKLEWKGGVKDSDVVFIPDHGYNGRVISEKDEDQISWYFSYTPQPEHQNCVSTKYDHTYQRNLFVPMNDHKFRLAVDPVDHSQATKSSSKGSKAAIYGFAQFDPNIDNHTDVDSEGRPMVHHDAFGKQKSSWKTYNFCAEYLYRPEEPTEFYEEVIKSCRFFGCKVLIESQKPGLINYMNERGYGHFLMNRPKETFSESNGKWGTNQDTVGMPASKFIINHYTGLMESFIVFHGHRIPFRRLLKQCLEFTPSKPTDFDAVVAAGNCLVASEAKIIAPKFEVKIEQYFKRYKNGRRT